MAGTDAVDAVVRAAHDRYSEPIERPVAAGLRPPLPFEHNAFNFAMYAPVLQPIESQVAHEMTPPGLAHMLRPGGILPLDANG